MKANVYNQSGESVETMELNPKIFALENIQPDVVHQVVVSLLSSKRTSVAHSKTRGEVRGGGKKPWQQKGTGRARAGSSRSPLWRGGGITFGPRSNRNWERKINKKVKKNVLFSVLTDKAQAGQLILLDNLSLTEPKTGLLAAKLKELQAKFPALGRKMTVVISGTERDLVRAGKNLKNIDIVTPSGLNILKLMSAPGLVVMKDALPAIEKIYLTSKD